jgi:predicted transcriptional regulator
MSGSTEVIPGGTPMDKPTTLKLPEALKRRVTEAARAADKSPHAFMLEAIERQTKLDEVRRAFVAEAVAARTEAVESGEGFAAADVHRYIAARVRGKRAPRPKATAWRKP